MDEIITLHLINDKTYFVCSKLVSNVFNHSQKYIELTSLGTRLTATNSKTSDLEKENAGL